MSYESKFHSVIILLKDKKIFQMFCLKLFNI